MRAVEYAVVFASAVLWWLTGQLLFGAEGGGSTDVAVLGL